jgi:hypothetical protein
MILNTRKSGMEESLLLAFLLHHNRCHMGRGTHFITPTNPLVGNASALITSQRPQLQHHVAIRPGSPSLYPYSQRHCFPGKVRGRMEREGDMSPRPSEAREQGIFFFFIFILLFIFSYKAWFIYPPCPHPLPESRGLLLVSLGIFILLH